MGFKTPTELPMNLRNKALTEAIYLGMKTALSHAKLRQIKNACVGGRWINQVVQVTAFIVVAEENRAKEAGIMDAMTLNHSPNALYKEFPFGYMPTIYGDISITNR